MHNQQSELFDLTANNTESGFRLEHLEVYNWGTFDKHIWRIEPMRENALLTGDIGSGKSTLVDAITTLLVPHQRIIYNKAAGADSKERNLYSYVRGEYKNEKDDFTQSAKAISLRDENHYTVLLGYFYNTGFLQGVTLAQVFWLKDNKRNPEKFFIVAQKPLTIAKHFSGFEGDILTLKKQLRQDDKIEIFDNFKEYSTRFRQLFGIHNEQALELFYQTVSMKSVGNLTEFVRHHMLEKHDIEQRIQELRHNFDNLNRAHAAVLKAKHQISLLSPLAMDIAEYQKTQQEITEHRSCRDTLNPFFAEQRVNLLNESIEKLQQEIQIDQQKLTLLTEELQQLHSDETSVKISIDNNGGERLQIIEQDILRLNQELIRKQKCADHYQGLAQRIKLSSVKNEEDFFNNRRFTQTLLQENEAREQTLQLKQVDVRIEIKNLQAKQTEITEELNSLKQRKNNIPAHMLLLRKNIIDALNIEESALPYVGELLQIAEAEMKWEGAIERVLHNFGLSLLVPEEFYSAVNYYVEKTNLKGKLVYYKIKTEKNSQRPLLEKNSLVNKLNIKSSTQFTIWLESELINRFNYICTEDLEEFRRLPQTLTLNGLIKNKGMRHEKDDRHQIQDRSRYILGWSNTQKIKALSDNLVDLTKTGEGLVGELTAINKAQEANRAERDACRDLLQVSQFTDLHWQPIVNHIQSLTEEKQKIEKTSDILQALKSQLETIQQSINAKSEQQTKILYKIGGSEQQLKDRNKELAKAEAILSNEISPEISKKLQEYQKLAFSKLKIKTLLLENVNECQEEAGNQIQKQVDVLESRHKSLTGAITKQMQAYKNHYPAETSELDVSPAAAQEYERMLLVLQNEDLPRHEVRFKEALNEGTINSIALFQNQLNREKQEIEERIRKINLSLHDIEYSTGTYIKLLIDANQDIEIRDFQHDIRRCLQNTLTDSDFYDEDKFLQVKALIERFNGREGMIDLDKRWTQKVCDVRNWFNFSASERWLADDVEKEFFSDSSGKSGGQKEKLAYTILASALAYQFGLEWGVTKSRSFRFVVIDEAFGKGSNDSTRYGLELFKKMNLQLLIVTPLQKIHVIEDYISSLHFVENQNGCNSVVRNLTIEQYREEKRKFSENANALSA